MSDTWLVDFLLALAALLVGGYSLVGTLYLLLHPPKCRHQTDETPPAELPGGSA